MLIPVSMLLKSKSLNIKQHTWDKEVIDEVEAEEDTTQVGIKIIDSNRKEIINSSNYVT
jgi:hypothetical protein